VKLAKAHGLGNDFLLVPRSELSGDPAELTRRLCDRHRGVGADGVIFFEIEGKGVSMRLYNADGGEAEISGNGLRCLSGYLVSTRAVPAEHVVKTRAGDKTATVEWLGLSRFRVVTDLGAPILEGERSHEIDVAGRRVRATLTSMGNPHCALYYDAPASDDEVRTLGPALERHALFPNRTNVEFITVVSRAEIRVRFWERGVGFTSASGTGSASAAVASILNGFTDREVRVVCDGGVLEVSWPEGGVVRQTGEVEVLFSGDWLPPL
jgi:diaminopimelate epimerase